MGRHPFAKPVTPEIQIDLEKNLAGQISILEIMQKHKMNYAKFAHQFRKYFYHKMKENIMRDGRAYQFEIEENKRRQEDKERAMLLTFKSNRQVLNIVKKAVEESKPTYKKKRFIFMPINQLKNINKFLRIAS